MAPYPDRLKLALDCKIEIELEFDHSLLELRAALREGGGGATEPNIDCTAKVEITGNGVSVEALNDLADSITSEIETYLNYQHYDNVEAFFPKEYKKIQETENLWEETANEIQAAIRHYGLQTLEQNPDEEDILNRSLPEEEN